MDNHFMKRVIGFIFLFLALTITPLLAQKSESVAVLTEVSGEVSVLSDGSLALGTAGQNLYESDIVKTGPAAKAAIKHKFGFTSTLGPNSTLYVSAVLFDISGLALGRGWLQTKGELPSKSQEFRVTTPVAATGVRGTQFLVVGANDGSSLVSVNEGMVGAGIGKDTMLVSAGQNAQGLLTKGFGPAASGQFTVEQGENWRQQKEKDLSNRVKEVLADLSSLQKKEDSDWEQTEKEITATTQKTLQGKMSSEDRLFLRRVLDIEDRMSARMLLAIDLREWAGITPAAVAQSERVRVQKVWQARDYRRKTWENAEQGKIPSLTDMPENLKTYAESMKKDMQAPEEEMPATVASSPETASLFPEQVPGVYLGMTAEELQKIRPNAKTDGTLAMLPQGDMPITYTEKQLSGGDWSKEGWFTGMYAFYKGKMIQGTFLAFSGTEKLRKQLLEKYVKLYGKPRRHRIEPDWAQPDVIKGSTVEWKGGGIEVILVSRNVPILQGNTRGLELRIHFAGFDAILESAGQFSPAAGAAAQEQIKKDFPELEGILSR